MPAASLSKRLMKVATALAKRYGTPDVPEFRDFIDCMAYLILELGTPEAEARAALERLRNEYVDWNDMRVATAREIQDVLGPDFPRHREKAEDIAALMADLFTAFRSMSLEEKVRTPDGIETLRALPDTTLIRVDLVDVALCHFDIDLRFPIDDEQFEILQFLGGIDDDADFEESQALILETLSHDEMMQLAHGSAPSSRFDGAVRSVRAGSDCLRLG